MKTCSRCLTPKALIEFYSCASARDGLRRACKECSYRSNKTGINAEASKAAKKRYYERNREEVIERSAKWREENRDQYNEYCRQNRDSLRARGYALKRKYGITLEQYDELFEKQGGRCAVCDRHQDEFKTSLAVDHSHKTRRIRGLLCIGCNYRLVAKHEDACLLRKVAAYIEQGTDWYVPEKPKKRRRKPRKAK